MDGALLIRQLLISTRNQHKGPEGTYLPHHCTS